VEPVVIETALAMPRVKAFWAFCCGVPPSVTRIVKLKEPSVVGVPLSTPPEERVNPPGNEPDATDHEYGVVPPVAAKVCVYAIPTTPPVSAEPVDIVIGVIGALIVMVNGFSAVCWRVPLSRTLIVKLNEPAALGVPLSEPPDVRVRPPGKDPEATDHVYGVVPFVAANV
jgi:hypothetical protein